MGVSVLWSQEDASRATSSGDLSCMGLGSQEGYRKQTQGAISPA